MSRMTKALLSAITVMTYLAFAVVDVQAEDRRFEGFEDDPGRYPCVENCGGQGEWREVHGVKYWYECGGRRGFGSDPFAVMFDGTPRGVEIYDPESDAWYWLDCLYMGAPAVNKEVYIPYVYRDEEPGSTQGKWVLYDGNGQMIKGWYTDERGTYYFDLITGAMAKGDYLIDGILYSFDPVTGLLDGGDSDPDTPKPANNLDNRIVHYETWPDGNQVRVDENGDVIWNDDGSLPGYPLKFNDACLSYDRGTDETILFYYGNYNANTAETRPMYLSDLGRRGDIQWIVESGFSTMDECADYMDQYVIDNDDVLTGRLDPDWENGTYFYGSYQMSSVGGSRSSDMCWYGYVTLMKSE